MTNAIVVNDSVSADGVASEYKNILKVRDDANPVWFSGSDGKYNLKENTEGSWLGNNEFSNKV